MFALSARGVSQPEMRSSVCARQSVIYCRVPGLLALAARRARPETEQCYPLAVTDGRCVRAVCPRAARAGVRPAMSTVQARRLCPLLLTIPAEAVPHQADTSAFLDILADHSPDVEPDGPDAAYAVLAAASVGQALPQRVGEALGLAVIVGTGCSRLAARACAECALPPERLPDAAVDWLWPEDRKVVDALKRLGLDTFGQVAAVGEDVLFYQFGRIGRLLHRRAQGQDLTPVRSLYPPPRADARYDGGECPIEDRQRLIAVLSHVSGEAAAQLLLLGRHGRRVILWVMTEGRGGRGELRREWSLPTPVQGQKDVLRAAVRLLSQMTGEGAITAPVTAVRLLVEGLETPQARTADLFARGPGDDPAMLEAVRRGLIARFGLRSLAMASQLPVSLRQERQACLREKWEAFR